MYINRKDGTRVEAKQAAAKWRWYLYKITGEYIDWVHNDLFRLEYGQAMICSNKECDIYTECEESKPHLKLNCGFFCIPYVPEKNYDVDKEPLFPVCGDCKKESNHQGKPANLLLSDEEICKKSCGNRDNPKSITCTDDERRYCGVFKANKKGIKDELDHLVELGIVYIYIKPFPLEDYSLGVLRNYGLAPLADYLKGEKL
jgi:hypothetical protein